MANAFTTVDLLGYCASATMLVGVLLVARLKAVGWLFKIAASGMWVGFAVATGYSSLLAESGLFILVNLYGWVTWSRKP